MQALQQQAAADRRQREELFNEEIERANSQADSRVAEAESQLQEAATRVMTRLSALAPDRPETLYLQGHFAASNGDVEAARQFWQDLLSRLPDDAPIADQLRAAIDAL